MSFKEYHCHAKSVFGENPALTLLCQNQHYPFAHEAAVFIPEEDALFITSNQFYAADGSRKIQISKVTSLHLEQGEAHIEEIDCPDVPMANGGVNYQQGVLFCAQGNVDTPGGLVHMATKAPYSCRTLINSFYGRHFNSVNDVVVHSDGGIWFTDPSYGFEQGIRPRPMLPNQAYRFQPRDGSIRAMADEFGRPNGICFSPDEKILYITDTDWIHGDGTTDHTRVSTIYAFDVSYHSEQPFLINRRLFAMADVGVPDGIKCDTLGNVYSGCGDGVNIWSAGGVLLGKILLDGGVSNFCFGREGELFLLNEHKLWKAELAKGVKGALLAGEGRL